MHTQLEALKGEKYYQVYKDHRILFSAHVSKSLGLQQQDTVVKIGLEKTRGALISATMNEIVLLANLTEDLQKKIYTSQGHIAVNLKFYDSLFKKEMSFNLFTKFLNMNNHGLKQKNMYYLSLKLRRKIPFELINIFGKHHDKINEIQEKGKRSVEGMLFARGVKKVCYPHHITGDGIIIDYPGDPQAFLNQKSMIVLKSGETGDVFEIIGKVDSDYRKINDSSRIRINYSLDQQSPRFAVSLKILTEALNN